MKRIQRRGVALATALMLMALILVIGLALATSSMMSLNLARQDYLEARCSLLARSGVNELIARLTRLESARPLQLFNPTPLDLRQAMPGKVELLPGCWLSFDTREPGYSTDNTLGDRAVAGWLDHGTTQTSVPPFTLELILNAEHGGFRRSYRALLRRTWPYAVYSGGGPLALCGDPGHPGGGCHVRGRVFAGLKPVDWRSFGTPSLVPRDVVFSMFTSGMKPQRNYDVPAQIGPPILVNSQSIQVRQGQPGADRPANEPSSYALQWGPGGTPTAVTDTGNELLGSVDYSDEQDRRQLQVEVNANNRWQGSAHFRLPIRSPLGTFTPGDAMGYSPWHPPARLFTYRNPYNPWSPDVTHIVTVWPPADPLANYDDGLPVPTWVLWGHQQLIGSPTVPTYAVVEGNVVNRVVAHGLNLLYQEFGPLIPVEEYGFQLDLQDAVLHIKGDLDLCNLTGTDPMVKGISGNGATLIVEGTLSLTGAQLRAGDRGMVIYADRVFLSGAGDFSGLIVAGNSISIIPQMGKRIHVRGGIVTAGSNTNAESEPGVVLRNVDVDYDPRYLKSLNNFGDYRLTGWEAL